MTDTPDALALALDARAGLPDTLKALFEAHPRERWGVDRPLGQLTAFWLERHQMLRALLEKLGGETAQMLDDRAERAPGMRRLARLGQIFAGELHMHHNVEDLHYFPALAAREKRLAAGFELLDSDHQALDAALHGFVEQSNHVIQAQAAGALADRDLAAYQAMLVRFRPMLERHLIDEEDLIVPILIEHGEAWLG